MVCIFANCKKIFKVKNYSDIIIVGAGLSGVGAACHLERKNPEKNVFSFLVWKTVPCVSSCQGAMKKVPTVPWTNNRISAANHHPALAKRKVKVPVVSQI